MAITERLLQSYFLQRAVAKRNFKVGGKYNNFLVQYLLVRDAGDVAMKLASVCNVSRQSISKCEADIALPETEKLLIC